MGLIRYSCGHILGHHEPIHVKFGVWRFFIMLYRNMKKKNENAEMQKKKKKKKIDDVTLWYSIDHTLVPCYRPRTVRDFVLRLRDVRCLHNNLLRPLYLKSLDPPHSLFLVWNYSRRVHNYYLLQNNYL